MLSAQSFEEIQVLGKHKFTSHFEAKIHPDRVMIQDMIAAEGNWVVIDEAEYKSIRDG